MFNPRKEKYKRYRIQKKESRNDAFMYGLLIVVAIVCVCAFIAIRLILWRQRRKETAPRYYRMIRIQETGTIMTQEKRGPHGEWTRKGESQTRSHAEEYYGNLVERERLRQLAPEDKYRVLDSTEPDPDPIEPAILSLTAGRLTVIDEDEERQRVAKKLADALDKRYVTRPGHDPFNP